MKCPRCGYDYSERVILSPVVVGSQDETKPICAICALHHLRQVYKSRFYMFKEEEALRQLHITTAERRRINQNERSNKNRD
jgi:hypothetical protein